MTEERKKQPFDKEGIEKSKHYNFGQIEVIDFIEDQRLGFHLGNTIKYICRSESSHTEDTTLNRIPLDVRFNDLRNLKKARWYLDRRIQKIEAQLNHMLEVLQS